MTAHKAIAQEGGGTSDFSTLLATYKLTKTASGSLRKWCRVNFVHWRAIRIAQNIHQKLESILLRQKVQLDTIDISVPLSQRVRQSLCYGLFCNVARVSPSQHNFRTMDGHSTVAYIHPSSVLFSCEKSLDWVLYMELVDTAKTYMRTLCPIKYSWIQELLPKLHEVDVYKLSSCMRRSKEGGERGVGEGEKEEEVPSAKRARREEERVQLKDRAAAAKGRYLARKAALDSDVGKGKSQCHLHFPLILTCGVLLCSTCIFSSTAYFQSTLTLSSNTHCSGLHVHVTHCWLRLLHH